MSTVPNLPPLAPAPALSPAAPAPAAPSSAPVGRRDLFQVVVRLVLAGYAVPLFMEFVEDVSGFPRQMSLRLPDNDRASVDRYTTALGLPPAWVSDYTIRGGTARLYESYHSSARTQPPGAPMFGAWHVMVSCRVHTGPEPVAPIAGRAQVPVAPRIVDVVA